MTHAVTNLVQDHFRGRTDAGAANDVPTWAATEDTNWTQAADTNFRVRFVVQENGGADGSSTTFKIQYNKNAAGWNDVTGASSIVRAADAGSSADEASITTSRLTGSGSFVNGVYDESGATSTSVTVTANNWTELEFGVVIVSSDVIDGDTIQLRVASVSGDSIAAYNQTPSITASVPATLAANAGSFAISGQAAALEVGYSLVSSAGSLSLSGQDATLSYTIPLPADAGAFALSGQASLTSDRRLPPEVAAFSLSGQAATMSVGFVGVSDAGSFSFSGQDSSVVKGSALSPLAGSFAIAGQPATLATDVVSDPEQPPQDVVGSKGSSNYIYLPPEPISRKSERTVTVHEEEQEPDLVSDEFSIDERVEQILSDISSLSRIDAEIKARIEFDLALEREFFEEEALLLLMAVS